MTFQPFSYQLDCLEAIQQARAQAMIRALVVMATGLGKTLTAGLDIQRWREHNGGRVLYLCHQNYILSQARVTFKRVHGLSHTYGFLNGQYKHKGTDFLFASFQTLQKRVRDFSPDEFDYLVVDETHHLPAPTYLSVVQHFKPKFLLGLTATPQRGDMQDIRQIYGEEVFHLSLPEALVRNLLTPVDYRLVTDDIQNLGFLQTSEGREANLAELNRTLFIPQRDEEIARVILKHMAEVPQPRVIVFCPSIAHCEHLNQFLPFAQTIHSRLKPHTQETRLDSFRNGDINMVLTVDKLNEGVDVPEANIIVFLRSTGSDNIFFQQLGRGLRKVDGKSGVRVLDFVGNLERLEIIERTLVKELQRTRKVLNLPAPIDDNNRIKFSEVAVQLLEFLKARHPEIE